MASTSKNNVLLDSYKTTVDEIDKNAQRQRSSASASYQRLLKYLPDYNAAMGITGGAAESTLLQANSDHASRVAAIEADAASQRNAAKLDYNNKVLDSYTENYNLAKDTISNWNGSSAELDEYIKGLDGQMSGEQYNNLLNLYKNQKEVVVEDEENQAKAEATYVGESRTVNGLKDEFEAGENFHVNLGTTTYNVEVAGENTTSESATILQAAIDAGIGDKEVFYYGGKVYLKAEGKIYDVRDRVHKSKNGLAGLTDYLKINSKEKSEFVMPTNLSR